MATCTAGSVTLELTALEAAVLLAITKHIGGITTDAGRAQTDAIGEALEAACVAEWNGMIRGDLRLGDR
jgi:hypothetical protein